MSTTINELNDEYSNNPLNNSRFEGKYNYANTLNSSVSAIQEKFDIIADDDAGWFARLGAGIVAIPYAVMLIPKAILTGLGSANSMLVEVGEIVGVPREVIYIVTFLLVIFIIGMLIKFFQKNE